MTLNYPREVAEHLHCIEFGILDHEVISCEQAAKAKGILLENELKTMILWEQENQRFIACHLNGHRKIDLRKVKKRLNVKQASLASLAQIEALDLSPGKVMPFLQSVWEMYHLIDAQVFATSLVSTNDGTRKGFISFPPKLLKLTNRYIVASIAK